MHKIQIFTQTSSSDGAVQCRIIQQFRPMLFFRPAVWHGDNLFRKSIKFGNQRKCGWCMVQYCPRSNCKYSLSRSVLPKIQLSITRHVKFYFWFYLRNRKFNKNFISKKNSCLVNKMHISQAIVEFSFLKVISVRWNFNLHLRSLAHLTLCTLTTWQELKRSIQYWTDGHSIWNFLIFCISMLM